MLKAPRESGAEPPASQLFPGLPAFNRTATPGLPLPPLEERDTRHTADTWGLLPICSPSSLARSCSPAPCGSPCALCLVSGLGWVEALGVVVDSWYKDGQCSARCQQVLLNTISSSPSLRVSATPVWKTRASSLFLSTSANERISGA